MLSLDAIPAHAHYSEQVALWSIHFLLLAYHHGEDGDGDSGAGAEDSGNWTMVALKADVELLQALKNCNSSDGCGYTGDAGGDGYDWRDAGDSEDWCGDAAGWGDSDTSEVSDEVLLCASRWLGHDRPHPRNRCRDKLNLSCPQLRKKYGCRSWPNLTHTQNRFGCRKLRLNGCLS